MTDILIIEDNRAIADGLRANLELEGYSVEVSLDGESGLARARSWNPSLVILDLMLPRLDGFHVLRRLRDEGFDMPVIILSARGSEVEKVRGFRIGADDYVTKPFGLAELLARVDAFMRRRRHATSARASPEDIVRFGEIEVRLASHEVFRRGERLALRPKEFELLRALIQRAGTVVTRNELLRDVWRYDSDVLTRTVDSHIVELRRQLEDDPTHPRFLITVRKSGYMLKFGDAAGVPL
jgi:two-component system, OmpR family, alkaline phosphatase synthesis response regulator PhoP